MDVYINYPKPHITIHCDPTCAQIEKQHKAHPRKKTITKANLQQELDTFRRQEVPFGANPATNDLWIHLDLGSPSDEEAVVHQIQALLGARYRPLLGPDRVKQCQFCC